MGPHFGHSIRGHASFNAALIKIMTGGGVKVRQGVYDVMITWLLTGRTHATKSLYFNFLQGARATSSTINQ